MTFRQFAFRNVLRNKRLYIAYFLSSLFTVMVFFTFANFAFHPVFSGGSVNQNALFGMSVAGGIIYIFSFFFVLYSMSSFLQSRKKEFGLLMTQGASGRQIRWMVFMENMLIGFFATVGGILFGLIFSKAILLIAENVLIINEALDFYFPSLAIVITFVSFILLFLFISMFVSIILRTKKLIHLIKGDKQSKGEPKASVLLAILAVLLLSIGYGVALYVEGVTVIMVMVPVVIVVTIGTYLLFTQLSVYLIRRLKGNKLLFWRKTNMLLFSDLSFRMKDNARTFFMVAIISTVAFSAIGTLYGFQSYLFVGMKENSHYSYTYHSFAEDNEAEIEQDIGQINVILQDENVQVESASIELNYFELGPRDNGVLVVNASDFNDFIRLVGEEELYPDENEVFVVNQSSVVLSTVNASDELLDSPILLENGQEIQPTKRVDSEILPELDGYYVVHDKVYEELAEPMRSERYTVWQADGDGRKLGDRIEAGRKIADQVGHKAQSVDFIFYEANKVFGPIMFIGLFIGIVFFVSAGSFLYFRLYMDLDEDKQKFGSIAKLGLSQGELKKVISRQTALLFFAPIVVALVHGAVALTALSRFFDYNLTQESTYVLGGFTLIQIGYFLVVRYFYLRQIRKAIF